MLIENLTDYEFYNRFYDYNKNGFVFNVVDNHFENFYYFSPRTIPEDHEKILVAYEENDVNAILGVIVYGNYGKGVEQAISYIDVNKQFQNTGIAKELILELNKYLDSKYILHISRISQKGKTCHLDELFTRLITKTEVKLSTF